MVTSPASTMPFALLRNTSGSLKVIVPMVSVPVPSVRPMVMELKPFASEEISSAESASTLAPGSLPITTCTATVVV